MYCFIGGFDTRNLYTKKDERSLDHGSQKPKNLSTN